MGDDRGLLEWLLETWEEPPDPALRSLARSWTLDTIHKRRSFSNRVHGSAATAATAAPSVPPMAAPRPSPAFATSTTEPPPRSHPPSPRSSPPCGPEPSGLPEQAPTSPEHCWNTAASISCQGGGSFRPLLCERIAACGWTFKEYPSQHIMVVAVDGTRWIVPYLCQGPAHKILRNWFELESDPLSDRPTWRLKKAARFKNEVPAEMAPTDVVGKMLDRGIIVCPPT
jgi:hypothetical protein